MFKKLILCLLVFSIAILVNAADCSKHPIYCQIKKNKPHMDNKKAMKLSNIIYKMADKYEVDAHILTAIFAQESGYKVDAKNCRTGLDAEALKRGEMKEVKVCFDFGIGQINWKNLKRRDVDVAKILSDKHYAVEIAAEMLAEFKDSYAKWDDDYWTRYNSRNMVKRELYKKLVERYK